MKKIIRFSNQQKVNLAIFALMLLLGLVITFNPDAIASEKAVSGPILRIIGLSVDPVTSRVRKSSSGFKTAAA